MNVKSVITVEKERQEKRRKKIMEIRVRTPADGDLVLENLGVEEAADTLLKIRDEGMPEKGIAKGYVTFGVFEQSDEQLELQMAKRTGLIDILKEKAKETLRLVPAVIGG